MTKTQKRWLAVAIISFGKFAAKIVFWLFFQAAKQISPPISDETMKKIDAELSRRDSKPGYAAVYGLAISHHCPACKTGVREIIPGLFVQCNVCGGSQVDPKYANAN